MKDSTYIETVTVPSIEDFALQYPQYAPFAQNGGIVLFERLTSPEALILAKAATNMNLAAVQGIADFCNSEFLSVINCKSKRFVSQFVGAVVCTMMEANGYARSGRKKSVNHVNFSKSEYFVPAQYSSRVEFEKSAIKKLTTWSKGEAGTGAIQVIDFFCGCGGMSLGFLASGKYKMLGGFDINRDAIHTYAKNIQTHAFEQDIVKLYEDDSVLETFLKKLAFDRAQPSVVIGCAPCQGFSAHRKKHRGEDDQRNSLVSIFASIAVQISPDCIVMENVPELLSDKYAAYFQEAKTTLENNGYKVGTTIVNAAEFGVPQARYRALVIAMKEKDPTMPQPLLVSTEFKTVKDAIGSLPVIDAGEVTPTDPLHRCARHKKSTIETIKKVPHDGGSRPAGVGPKCLDEVNGFYDVYGRLSWRKPSITITHYARNPASGRFVHPEQDRGLTLREMACLQGFPFEFEFCGGFDSIAKQIGEAVPPRLSAAVAGSICWDLLKKEKI